MQQRGAVGGALDPSLILTQSEPPPGMISAYQTFDQRESGWVKVELRPAA